MNDKQLSQAINNLEHILDVILPKMLAAKTIELIFNDQQLTLQSEGAIKSINSSVASFCVSRLEELEHKAGIRSPQMQLKLSHHEEVRHG